jgi:hypothetical protein
MRDTKGIRTERKQAGQSMVELALLLPFLLLLLVATVEAGFALRDYLMLQSVNREGVRWAARTPPGEEYRDHFYDEGIGGVFDRIHIAADNAGLRAADVNIVFTHIYILDDGSAGIHQEVFPPGFVYPSRPSPTYEERMSQRAQDNADKAASVNATRVAAGYEPLSNEVIVIETFYRHETLWGIDIVGPFGEDWTMYALSTMRLIGTGRSSEE